MLARAGLISYSGPRWSSFGLRDHFEPTGRWFRAAVMDDEPIVLQPAPEWTDDPWFADQDHWAIMVNDGWRPLSPGSASGRIIGGNLCTLNLLQGTPYFPDLAGALLFLEDDHLTNPVEFARDLTSLLQVRGAADVRGLVIGRFQRASAMDEESLAEIVRRQPALRDKPVLAGLDFGHTSPLLTFPIGGEATLEVNPGHSSVVITRH